MFKKLNEKLDKIFNEMIGGFTRNDKRYVNIYNDIASMQIAIQHMPKIQSLEKTIESQQRTIEQLTNALKDKYEHGLFVFSEDGKIPTVIRNGKELTNELTSYFGIDWTRGELPNISIEQHAGTYYDSEV